MKRFASHYLLIPNVGLAKQQVVEVNDAGAVQNLFPLTEEIESVEWMPGVIVLLSAKQYLLSDTEYTFFSRITPCGPYLNLSKYLHELEEQGEILLPYLFYPFDFISMQPVDGTRHRLLR